MTSFWHQPGVYCYTRHNVAEMQQGTLHFKFIAVTQPQAETTGAHQLKIRNLTLHY